MAKTKTVLPSTVNANKEKVISVYSVSVAKGINGGHPEKLAATLFHSTTKTRLQRQKSHYIRSSAKGYDAIGKQQAEAWGKIWEMSDITIDGDVKAQQGIRFNIFQLNQTYLGKRFATEHRPERIYRRKIRRFDVLGYRSVLHSVLHGDERPACREKPFDLSLQPARQGHRKCRKARLLKRRGFIRWSQ
jgi:hypothetical protein